MERTAPLNESLLSQRSINQDLTLEEVKNRGKPKDLDYRLGTNLGGGTFGTVYSVDIYKRTREKAAMKVIRKANNRGEYETISQKDLDEIKIMSKISNPYINSLIDFYFQTNEETKQEELVLFQPLGMCDLKRFLKENYQDENVQMTERQAIEFLAQLAIGLKTIHDNNIIHRDFNPQNILVFKNEKKTPLNDQEFILKITDFGCSKILKTDEEIAMTNVGKFSYMPKEQRNKTGYNQSVDIYALGITLFEMITGQVLDAEDIIRKSIDTQYYSSEFINLLYKLCSLDQKERPTIDELIEDPLIYESQTFTNCLLNGILPLTNNKLKHAIDYLVNFECKCYGRYYQKRRITEGELVNGKFEGEACQYRIINGINWYFDGNYINNELNGYGAFINSYGEMYCGEFKNGQRHGFGTHYKEGDIFEGQWMKNNKNGEGVMKYANGNIEKGAWKDDKKHGEFIITYACGRQEKIIIYMDKTILNEEAETALYQ
eukprot:403347725